MDIKNIVGTILNYKRDPVSTLKGPLIRRMMTVPHIINGVFVIRGCGCLQSAEGITSNLGNTLPLSHYGDPNPKPYTPSRKATTPSPKAYKA